MKSDAGNMNNQIVTLLYESPKLKKYGSMKDFTLSNAGSGGDASGRGARATGLKNTTADSPVIDTAPLDGDLGGPGVPFKNDTTFDFPNPINDGQPGAD